MKSVLLIPAYNEAGTIADVVRAARPYADAVVVIDDGSTDGTVAALAGLDVEVLRHFRNLGKSASLRDGFAAARGLGARQIITMDADGQHRAADVPRLLRAAELHPRAIIIGARMRSRHAAPIQRRVANGLADFGVSWAIGRRVVDSQSGQRLYPAALFDALDVGCLAGDGFTLESEILIEAAAAGFATFSVPIETIYDRNARPSYFHPIAHTAAIAAMLARRIVPFGLRLPALVTMLRDDAHVVDERAGGGARDGGGLDAQPGTARP
jgi:glycosyltransferase involved in cell wall biosynthesis